MEVSMKVTTHIVVQRGYARGITASQDIGELIEQCDDYNRDQCGENWQQELRERAIVSVEFEVPDSVFQPPPPPVVLQGTVNGEKTAEET